SPGNSDPAEDHRVPPPGRGRCRRVRQQDLAPALRDSPPGRRAPEESPTESDSANTAPPPGISAQTSDRYAASGPTSISPPRPSHPESDRQTHGPGCNPSAEHSSDPERTSRLAASHPSEFCSAPEASGSLPQC